MSTLPMIRGISQRLRSNVRANNAKSTAPAAKVGAVLWFAYSERARGSGSDGLHPNGVVKATLASNGDDRSILQRQFDVVSTGQPLHQIFRRGDRPLCDQRASFGGERQGIGDQPNVPPVDHDHSFAA